METPASCQFIGYEPAAGLDLTPRKDLPGWTSIPNAGGKTSCGAARRFAELPMVHAGRSRRIEAGQQVAAKLLARSAFGGASSVRLAVLPDPRLPPSHLNARYFGSSISNLDPVSLLRPVRLMEFALRERLTGSTGRR